MSARDLQGTRERERERERESAKAGDAGVLEAKKREDIKTS
jgi:hypothetical protein